jgi:hypothetical protein
MSAPQPISYFSLGPGNRDAEHLRLLAIFHFIAGGLALLCGCIPIVHVVVGIFMVAGKLQNVPPQMGFFFIVIGTIFILIGWAMGICLIISGIFLKRRRYFMFSFVIAGIACAQVPFGTLLGVFTIVVLSRPSVKVLYGRAP